MKKKLVQRDLSKIVKVKLVKLLMGNQYNNNLTNRFFFTNDGQLDKKIIVGVQAHCGSAFTNPGPTIVPGDDVPFSSIYDIPSSYQDEYYTGIMQSNITTGVSSFAYLSLVNPEGRFFWYQQPLSSINYENMGRYHKRLYSRITLDKCYVETPTQFASGVPGVPITTYQLFSFFYIDDPNF